VFAERTGKGNAAHVMRIDPVVKGEGTSRASSPKCFRWKCRNLRQTRDAFAGRGVTELTKVIAMNQPAFMVVEPPAGS
jgi:hypothetical protein